MEWSEIQSPPQGLRFGEQTVRIASVREYRNPKGNQCVELVLENDDGGRLPICRSIEPEHRIYIERFLQTFLGITVNDVVRQGGWETLLGSEFMVDVDYPDGMNPSLMAMYNPS